MAIGTTAALIGASVAGGAATAYAGNKAAKAQSAAAAKADATQRYIFDRNVELSEPWRDAGTNALAAMQYEMGLGEMPAGYQGFTASPGYDFRRDEGNKAIERMAAARGLRLSGATLKDSARFTDGLASSEYGNHYNRLASMAGLGQSATGQQMNAGTNYANASSQNALAAGNARASGYQNTANAFTGTMGDIGGLMMMNKLGVFQ
jgi:hypothetical protein